MCQMLACGILSWKARHSQWEWNVQDQILQRGARRAFRLPTMPRKVIGIIGMIHQVTCQGGSPTPDASPTSRLSGSLQLSDTSASTMFVALEYKADMLTSPKHHFSSRPKCYFRGPVNAYPTYKPGAVQA